MKSNMTDNREITMGLIHIYCGNGKGKTTAALGLALRAAGSGMKVHFVQLLKGGKNFELESLSLIPNISVDRSNKNYGFTFKMSDDTKTQLIQCHNVLLKRAYELMNSGTIDMLIIDEFNAAYEYNLLDRNLADQIITMKPQKIELVLTGRNPQPKFIDVADYVSEINPIKHPYSCGQKARKGIEF